MIAVLPNELKPRDDVDLVRVGPNGDGGYVIPRDIFSHTDWLVSLGLSDDWRFEAAFQFYVDVPVCVYDHTVTEVFWFKWHLYQLSRRIRRLRPRGNGPTASHSGYRAYRKFFQEPQRTHHRIMVGTGTGDTISVSEILSERPSDSVFLKMDIEGWEWRTLDDIVSCRDRLVGLAVEFHDVDLHLTRLCEFVKSMTGFGVVNVNANNFRGVGLAHVPMVVEVTFAKMDLLSTKSEVVDREALNAPNCATREKITVTFV